MPEMVINSDQSVIPSFGHVWGMPLTYNGQYGSGWVAFIGGYALQFSGETSVQTDQDDNPIGFTVTLDGSFTVFTNGAVAGTGTMPPFTYTSTLSNGDTATPDGNGGWRLGIHGSPSGSTDGLGPFGEFVAGLDRIVYNGADGDDVFDGSYVDTSVAAYGGEGADTLYGAFRHANTLYGEGGNDSLHGLGVGDHLDGGAGDDYVEDGDSFGDGTIQTPPQDSYNADRLIGGDGNDYVISTGGGDVLEGGAGNDYLQASERPDADTLTGGSGDDQINGGGGVDTAVFAGLRSQYVIARIDVGYEAYTVVGPDGSDTFWDIENIRFDDGTFSVAQLVNDPPTITSNSGAETAAVAIQENTTAVTTVVGSDPNGDALTYSIAGGADATRFQIDSQTGVLSFISAPDFETPADAGADNMYDVIVQVADALGASDTQTIAVTVTNVSGSFTGDAGGVPTVDTLTGTNEEDVISGLSQADTLTGLDGNDTLLGGNGSDTLDGGNGDDTLDGGDGADLLIGGAGNDTMLGGNGPDRFIGGAGNDAMAGGAGSDTLDYGSEGGELGVYVNLLGRSPQYDDLIGPDKYPMEVDTAFDSFGDKDSVPNIPNVIGTQHADVIYGGNHDNILQGGAGADSILGGGRNDTLDGGEGADTVIYRGNRADYTVVSNADGSVTITDLRPETVDPVDNVLNDGVDTAQNFEFFQFEDGTVSLADLLNPPPVNQPPVITSNGGTNTAAIPVQENTTAVTTVTGSDPNGDALTYSIAGGADAGRFQINSQTGVLSFVDVPNFEAPVDDDANNVYEVIVETSDGHGGVDSQTISVTVSNLNEAQTGIVLSGGVVNEFSNLGTVIGTLSASDPDTGDQQSFTLLDNAGGRFALVNGNQIIVNNGVALDFEQANSHQITVRATDTAGNSIDRAIAVGVVDVNPELVTGTVGNDVIYGGGAADGLYGNFGNDTLVGGEGDDFIAGQYDVDVLTGGAGKDTFAGSISDWIGDRIIDYEYGEDILVFGGPMDGSAYRLRAENGETFLEVGGNGSFQTLLTLSGVIAGTISVGTWDQPGYARVVITANANGAPVITSNGGADTAAISLQENTTAVTTITGSDPDGDTLTYSIAGGSDAGRFQIDSQTGVLSFVSAPDFEMAADIGADNVYDVTVQASDDRGGIGTQAISVTVTDVSDNAPINGTAASNTLNGGSGADIINGLGGNDTLNGMGGNDLLNGGAGADTLNGGTGSDNMQGGAGNDTYVIDDIGDIADEGVAGSTGTDSVQSSVTFSLVNSAMVFGVVENLTLTGNGNIDATGNDVANVLTGNGGDNVLNGGGGNDTLVGNGGNDTLDGGVGADNMRGGAGDDIYVVDNGADRVNEGTAVSGGNDTVRSSISFRLSNTARVSGNVENLILTGIASINAAGNALNNRLVGNAGDNVLDGGGGADHMSGGGSNDTYIVDNVNDTIDESGVEASGNDTVVTSFSFSLAQSSHVLGGIENLTLTGAADVNATGNDADNGLIGNRGNNILDGGNGNDVLSADGGNDTLLGGTGNDTLSGGAGSDFLDGGTGADSMQGGAGNDTYVVDDVGDVVQEGFNQGVDTVLTSLPAFTLSDNVENLVYTGSSAFTGTGNALNNNISGGSTGDQLNGGAGNDFLAGGGGNDVLTGGAGADQFAFNTVLANAGVDEITDFVSTGANASTHDRLVLDNADGMFTQVGSNGALARAAFWTSATGEAHDSSDRLIYNTTNGSLTYDSNGNASGGTVVHFATLQPNLTLQASDFLVV
ncbi:beta strand repeat-containing protein [Rhizobium mongolense]